MKVHFPLLGFNLSGGIRVIITLANGLVRLGHEVRITVPAFRAEPPLPLESGLEVIVLGQHTDSRIGYARNLVSEAAQWGDVLVATNSRTPFLLSRSIRRNRSSIPLVYLAAGYDPVEQGELFDGPRWRRIVNKQIALRSYALADHRFFLTRYVAQRVGLDPDPVVIRCGVEHDVFRPGERADEGPFRIGVIGRFAERKGLPYFFKAWSQLLDLQEGSQVVVWPTGVGRGFSLPKEAEVYPVCSDEVLANFYRSLDLFVFPSLFEGFGLPPLEAMACGVPVVLTDSGGVSEFAVHEENCLVVPTRDSRSLAAAIKRMVDSPELRERLRAKGLETARKFTWENTIQKFHEGLLRVVNQPT